MDTPPIRSTRAGKIALAYQVVGEGPDVVWHLGWPTHLDLLWEHPAMARSLRALASVSRLILFDFRGMGLSDRGPMRISADHWIDDINAVLDAVGSTRATLVGGHFAGRVALLFAATPPDRISAVPTIGSPRPRSETNLTTPGGPQRRLTRQLLSQLRFPWTA